MFLSNNDALFHLWWKQNLIKHQKVSKYYQNDAEFTDRYSPQYGMLTFLSLFTTNTLFFYIPPQQIFLKIPPLLCPLLRFHLVSKSQSCSNPVTPPSLNPLKNLSDPTLMLPQPFTWFKIRTLQITASDEDIYSLNGNDSQGGLNSSDSSYCNDPLCWLHIRYTKQLCKCREQKSILISTHIFYLATGPHVWIQVSFTLPTFIFVMFPTPLPTLFCLIFPSFFITEVNLYRLFNACS